MQDKWRATVTGLLLCLGLLGPGLATAVEQIRVVALFAGKAMLEIDGKRHLLEAGKATPEGVLLISASAEAALIEVDGRQESYPLGSVAGGSFAPRRVAEVKISRGPQGGFMTVGTINGRMTDMMVDTGASSIAMSEVEARRLGIQYRLKGKRIGVSTASGQARGYQLLLDRVRVGEIVLTQVEGIVIEGASPRQVLLGMSFLNRVNMENEGSVLILQSRF